MKVNLKPLKVKAISFPEPLKSVIFSEPDEMDSVEFIAKMSTWDKLLVIGGKKNE